MTQTMPHDSSRILVFCCRKPRQNSNCVSANQGAKCRWGGLNEGAVAENWRLSSRSVVNLARPQVYHTRRPSACSQCVTCVARVCQRQLILVAWRDGDAHWRGGAEGIWNWTSNLELAGSVPGRSAVTQRSWESLSRTCMVLMFTKQLVPAKGGDTLKLGR